MATGAIVSRDMIGLVLCMIVGFKFAGSETCVQTEYFLATKRRVDSMNSSSDSSDFEYL